MALNPLNASPPGLFILKAVRNSKQPAPSADLVGWTIV